MQRNLKTGQEQHTVGQGEHGEGKLEGNESVYGSDSFTAHMGIT